MANIPLPKLGYEEFGTGMNEGSEMIKRLMDTRNQQGNLAINQQAALREQQMHPLKLDELRQKIREQEIANRYKAQYMQSQINANNALSNQRKTGTGGLGTGGKEQQFYQSLIAQDNPHLNNDPVKVYEAANRLAAGFDTMTDGTKINISPAARSSLDRITKSGSTAQGLNQQRYASTTEMLVKNASQNAQAAVKYSGILNGASGSLEKLKSSLGGEGSPEYQQYMNFTRTDVPTIAGEFMRELGVNASDEQKRMYIEVINPLKWDSDPTTALARWNYFKQLVGNVGKQISKSPSQIQSELQNGSNSGQSKENSVIKKITEFSEKAIKAGADPIKVQQRMQKLQSQAEYAISNGADPEKVMERLSKMNGG